MRAATPLLTPVYRCLRTWCTGTVDVSAGTLTVAIQFVPGTLDRSTSRLTIELDTDQNPSTGIRTSNGLGVDYAIDMWAATHRPGRRPQIRADRRLYRDRSVLHPGGFGDV